MEERTFYARVISNNRITLDEKVTKLMHIKKNDLLKVTIEVSKQ